MFFVIANWRKRDIHSVTELNYSFNLFFNIFRGHINWRGIRRFIHDCMKNILVDVRYLDIRSGFHVGIWSFGVSCSGAIHARERLWTVTSILRWTSGGNSATLRDEWIGPLGRFLPFRRWGIHCWKGHTCATRTRIATQLWLLISPGYQPYGVRVINQVPSNCGRDLWLVAGAAKPSVYRGGQRVVSAWWSVMIEVGREK